jgi:DNA adenine methylase
MPRPRKYLSNAEKQKAYRKRNAEPLRNQVAIDHPPIRWLGGKWRIADWIISTFPPHTAYVEAFGGGANVLLQKPPSRLEIYNDLDSDVVNFFTVLRSIPRKLVEQIELTPFAREELESTGAPSSDSLERARRFFVRCWQSFQPGSGYDKNPSWRFQKSWARGKSTINEWNTTDHLWNVAKRLKHVQFENRPALEVIQRFDHPTTLFYIDPPYLASTRSMSAQTRYKYELGLKEHRELARVLRNVTGMVVLSGYGSSLYDELYSGWSRIAKTTTTNGNSVATEFLWLSPRTTALEHLPLFAISTVRLAGICPKEPITNEYKDRK